MKCPWCPSRMGWVVAEAAPFHPGPYTLSADVVLLIGLCSGRRPCPLLLPCCLCLCRPCWQRLLDAGHEDFDVCVEGSATERVPDSASLQCTPGSCTLYTSAPPELLPGGYDPSHVANALHSQGNIPRCPSPSACNPHTSKEVVFQ